MNVKATDNFPLWTQQSSGNDCIKEDAHFLIRSELPALPKISDKIPAKSKKISNIVQDQVILMSVLA